MAMPFGTWINVWTVSGMLRSSSILTVTRPATRSFSPSGHNKITQSSRSRSAATSAGFYFSPSRSRSRLLRVAAASRAEFLRSSAVRPVWGVLPSSVQFVSVISMP